MNMPISGATEGSMKAQMTSTTTGKIIFSVLLTVLSCFISTERSFFVVSSFMMGG